MALRIHPEIFGLFPGLQLAVVRTDTIDNHRERPGIGPFLEEAWREAGEAVAAFGNPQSHPRIEPWRTRLRAAGASPREFPSSVEALARRAGRGGDPFRINPLVDFYNAVSLRHLVPAGGFDLAAVGSDVDLRVTRGGERFAKLGTDGEEPVGAGEVAYLCGEEVLTRHFVWRQSRIAAITPDTGMVMLMAEVLGEIEPPVASEVADALTSGIHSFFGAEARTAVLSEDRPELD